VKALQLGARGLVMKESATELLKAMRTVMAGECWVGHESFTELTDALRSTPTKVGLTPVSSRSCGW
jgi:DNA-binding NarL/FixJ family response regulator